MSIGQHIDMDICVPEDGLSDHHAALEAVKQLDSYRYIIKAESEQPLLELNGETVSHAELQDGDWILIGGVEFQFTDDGISCIKEMAESVPAEERAHANIVETQADSTIFPATNPTTKTPPKPAAKSSTSPLELIKELKEEVESITTESLVDDAHFSRRLRFF